MLSVTYISFMMCVIMLNVVMLSFVMLCVVPSRGEVSKDSCSKILDKGRSDHNWPNNSQHKGFICDICHNDTHNNDTQNNDTQHIVFIGDTQHKVFIGDTQHKRH
jgi:hypothetical protein